MNADTPAIAIDCVQFRYGHLGPRRRDAPLVLKDISLSVSAGDILCLLGPSGCGKTTLVNLVMGVDVPTSGTVRVLSEVAPFRTARARIGFMPQDDALYEDITAEENLRFFAALYGVKGERLARRMDELFAFVRLEAHRKKLVHDYSGRHETTALAGGSSGARASVLVLDEPTVGLDPEHRRYIWNHLEALAVQGCAIVVTTHVMDEAERCARIAMIREGRLIADAPPADILARTGTSTWKRPFWRWKNRRAVDTAAKPEAHAAPWQEGAAP
ncbi:MAG: ABC transporter ATP-binding protein [Collinsella sp.]